MPRTFFSKAKNTPYDDARFTGRVRRTYVGGSPVFERLKLCAEWTYNP